MITMDIPDDNSVLVAVGTIALRHSQLDYILRMTVKSILRISVREARNATARQGSRELRNRVRILAKQKFGEGETLVKLDALLNRARRATENRNDVLHSLWAQDRDGNAVIRDDDSDTFQPGPNKDDLETLANDLAIIASELNSARLDGFLKDLVKERDSKEIK